MKMNKIAASIILATAMPGAAIAADVSNTLYGDFRWSVGSIEAASSTESVLQTNNNASRVGIKGSVKEGGLSAIYHVQLGAQNDTGGTGLTSRFYFAGLKGDFGKVIYGRHSTAYKMAGVKMDPFYDTSAGTGNGGVSYGMSGLTNGFTNNSIAYTSPKLGGGFTVNAAAYIDDAATDDHDTNIGVAYSDKSLTAGIQLISVGGAGVIANAAGADSATRLYGTYKMDAITVGASFEQVAPVGPGDDATFTYLTGSYMLDKASKVSLSLGSVSDGSTAGGGLGSNGDSITFGYFTNVLPKTQVYVLYSGTDFDDNTERSAIAVGVSHKFGMTHK